MASIILFHWKLDTTRRYKVSLDEEEKLDVDAKSPCRFIAKELTAFFRRRWHGSYDEFMLHSYEVQIWRV